MARAPSTRQIRFLLKPLVLLGCLAPGALLLADALGVAGASLGANPVEALLHRCGKWALNFLLLTLCMTPLARLVRASWPIRFRRMLGLTAFAYASLHLAIYLTLDQGLAWSFILEDIAERPYITIGFTAWLALLPLAATSTRRAMRRLKTRWRQLHRLIYPVAGLAVWHYWWQVKQDIREPVLYALAAAVLLGLRWHWHRSRQPAARAGAMREGTKPGQVSGNPAP